MDSATPLPYAAFIYREIHALKIYTKTGDAGMTGLLGPGKFSKDEPRIDAYGTVDELNAAIGVARAAGPDVGADALLARVQDELFVVGSALADPDPEGPFHRKVGPDLTAALEADIDAMESELTPLTQFILPGGTPAAAHLHLARTICRRAERLVVHLSRQPTEAVPIEVSIYLNRLSDFLFVIARVVNSRAGVADIPWTGG
jgi:cob(I)alamin adenosyltransferase